MRAVFGGRPAPRDYSGSKEGDRKMCALNWHLAWSTSATSPFSGTKDADTNRICHCGNGCIVFDSSVMITLLSL